MVLRQMVLRHVTGAVLVLVCAAGAWGAPLKVVFVTGSAEYDSDTSMPAYERWLEAHYDVDVTLLKANGWEDLPGLEALETCDTALFFTRRLRISGEQLERVKRYLGGGKPIVAVRTASHGFQGFLEFDKEVAGGNYRNHLPDGPTLESFVVPGAAQHPILAGVGPIKSRCSVYRTGPLAADTQELLHVKTMDGKQPIFWMRGKTKEGKPIHEDADQPLAWTREHKGGRVFYVALGNVQDFENAAFQRLIANGLFWTARREPEAKPLPPVPTRVVKSAEIALPVQQRKNGGAERATLNASNTALILCDVWDMHWCAPASERLDALVPRMEEVVRACRAAGIAVIHAPSDTMAFYEGTIPRRRMQEAPQAPAPQEQKCETPRLPIDDSDGGCTDNNLEPYSAWTRQHAGISIDDVDGVSDSGREVYNYLAANGITNLLIMGVHTNMCVLNRGFAIRQMTRWGISCYLVRDLTDTMYDPEDPPKVSHDEGTDLVVKYIEEHYAPSLLSADLLSALPKP